MMILGLSSVMSFANVLNDSTQNEETFVASTSEEDDAWIKIKDGKEEQAYRAFLAKYPNSQYAEQAASVIALYDAMTFYNQGKYGEACEQFGKAMVYNELTTDMKEKYETAQHAEKYKNVGNGPEYSAREYLQEFPNGMYATEASNNIARKMADNFENGYMYYSSNEDPAYPYNDVIAYAKDFETYQYVKRKSNEKAISITNNNYSHERKYALKWAQDEETKLYVEKEVSANERKRSTSYRLDCLVEKLSPGIEFNFLDFAKETYGLDIGLSFRIGSSWYAPFNFIGGVKYRYHEEYIFEKGKGYINDKGHHVVGSCQFRYQFLRTKYDGSGYLGIGGEYSHHFRGDLNLGGAYIIAQIGCMWKHFDFGIYYKHRVYKESKNEIFDDNYRIGIPLTYYFW